MPLHSIRSAPAATTAGKPDTTDKIRRFLGMGARVASGIGATMAASTAPVTGPLGIIAGGAIGGLGEAGAELLEGSPLNLARMGVEAAIGAVPLGKIFKAGRVAESAIKSGAMSAAGTAGRQWSEGEPISPREVAISGGLGALLGGVLTKSWGGKPTAPPPPKPILTTPPVIGEEAGTFQYRVPPSGVGAKPYSLGPTETSRFQEDVRSALSTKLGKAGKEANTVAKARLKELDAAIKAEKDAATAGLIQKAASERGLVPSDTPQFTKAVSASIKGGRLSMRTPFKAGKKQSAGTWREEGSASELEDLLKGKAKGTPKPPAVPPSTVAAHMDRYKAWVAKGVSHEEAVANAKAGLMPPPKAATPAVPIVPTTVAPVVATLHKNPDFPGVGRQWDITLPGGGKTTVTAKSAVEQYGATNISAEELARDAELRAADLGLGGAATAEENIPRLRARAPELEIRDTGELSDFLKGVAKRGRATEPLIPSAKVEPPIPTAPAATTASVPFMITKQMEAELKAKGFDQATINKMTPAAAHDALRAAAATRPPEFDQYPPEVVAELDKLGPQYRAAQGAEKRGLGAQLSEIRDFMSGKKMRESWRGAEPSSGEKGEISTALLARLGLGAGGALIGAATDPLDNPLESAIAGGAVGFAVPSIPNILKGIGELKGMGVPGKMAANLGNMFASPKRSYESLKNMARSLPQYQRFSLLADEIGLPMNAWVGPWASALMAGLEYGFSGDPRGWAVLRELNPITFLKAWRKALPGAEKLIASGEMGRAETEALSRFGTGGEAFGQFIRLPGKAMTAGDMAIRDILQKVGFSPEEARRITLTMEPELKTTKWTASASKGKPIIAMMAPFTRTTSNIAEQGFERLPGIGFITQSYRKTPDPLRQQLVQQGMSLGTGFAGYQAGKQFDPTTSPSLEKAASRFTSNVGGQYSLPATIGYVMGQAARKGKPAFSAANIAPAVNALPLPTTRTAAEWAKFITGEGTMPRGIVPAVYRNFLTPKPTTLKGLRGLKKRE